MNMCKCSKAEFAQENEVPLRAQPTDAGLVTIEREPIIGETPQATLQSWLTPNPLFYIRNHYAIPTPDAAKNWALALDGHLDNPISFTADDFRHFPKQTLPITLECAGNNRSDLQPGVPGNPFQNGAISNAIWAGVPLHLLLERAGVRDGAVELLFEGMDAGEPAPDQPSQPYLRSLPIDVAMHPHTLLAYEMNGEPLSREHGSPLRLIVPGWYGMASVKWLRRVTALKEPFTGFFQRDRYIVEDDAGGVSPVAAMQVKSLISWPQPGATLSPGRHNVNGMAWSGAAHISRVEISDDGGETWRAADLTGPRYRYAWQQWNFMWTPPASGQYTLAARATDEAGNIQPLQTRWNSLGYIINGVKPVQVEVA